MYFLHHLRLLATFFCELFQIHRSNKSGRTINLKNAQKYYGISSKFYIKNTFEIITIEIHGKGIQLASQ